MAYRSKTPMPTIPAPVRGLNDRVTRERLASTFTPPCKDVVYDGAYLMLQGGARVDDDRDRAADNPPDAVFGLLRESQAEATLLAFRFSFFGFRFLDMV